MMEKIRRMSLLNDFYGPLLTQKQQQVISLHYENDWSLTEIADEMNITRQGVYDLLKRAEKVLEDYEDRLGLMDRFIQVRQQMDRIYALLANSAEAEAIDEAMTLLKEITELL